MRRCARQRGLRSLDDPTVEHAHHEAELGPVRGAASKRSARRRSAFTGERFHGDGPRMLSDVELLALVLGTGNREQDAWSLARQLLTRSGGLAALADLSARELEALPGVGAAGSVRLASALELGRRIASVPLVRGEPIRSPSDVHRHFGPLLRGRLQESFHALLLDARHRLMSVVEVSVGTLTASLVHPREVFREAVRQAAAAIVLVHHHPSGDPSPSPEDRSVTDRLCAAGSLLGIRVVDHVIVGDSHYFSFQEADRLPAASASEASDRRAP